MTRYFGWIYLSNAQRYSHPERVPITMKSIISIILFNFFVSSTFCCSREIQNQKSFPRVTTTLGTIEGFYRTSSNGRPFRAFQGIPYAQPPIGESRFEVPNPVSAWNGVLIAKEYSSACLQYNTSAKGKDLVEGSEDCLYLNVFTPIEKQNSCKANRSSSALLPVIVFIHGGAFQRDSASNYGPGYLLNRDVIVVTINYRLGLMGFLSTKDKIVPGNMGLKDQVIALRWVKDNIKSFGGDPSKILLTGQSAGGASVQYHYLTNTTRGLFHGGLSISGSAFDCWAQAEKSLEKAKRLASIVGCPTYDNQLMVNCFKAKPAHQLVEALSEFSYWLNIGTDPFGPTLEKAGGKFTFMDRSPIDVITSGDAQDLPWVTSNVSEEGLSDAASFIVNETLLEQLNRNWTEIAPYLLDYNYTIRYDDHARIARLIRRHYLGSKPIAKSTTKQIIDIVGNRIFQYNGGKAAKLQARFSKSPVRFYYFSYRGAHSFTELIVNTTVVGTGHKDDLIYVFQMGVDATSTPRDRAIQKKLIDFWVSFAANLKPKIGRVNWAPVDRYSKKLNYLHIAGPDQIRMESSENFGDIRFWDSLGFKENIPSTV